MRKKMLFILTTASVIFTLSLQAVADVIRVCNSCGYELYPATASFCSNCGAATGGKDNTISSSNQNINTEKKTNLSSEETSFSQIETISQIPLGEDDFETIKSAIAFYLEKANSRYLLNSNKSLYNAITAYYYLIEADGLLELLPPNDNVAQKTKQQIATQKRQILSIIPRIYTLDCPKCKGKGFIDFLYLTHGNKIERKTNSVECPLCKTRKFYPYFRDHASLNRIVTQARFEVFQQKEANEFVQKIIEKQITTTRPTIPQKAAYNKATALPCEHCFGFRLEQCRICKGLGLTKCNDRDCEDGYKKEKKPSSNGRNDVKRIESLSKLQPCEECDGVAYIRCEECIGRGGTICKQCHGTGSKEICNKCEGVGYSECTRCTKNYKTKQNKRTCNACNDSMLILCNTCDGAGVK